MLSLDWTFQEFTRVLPMILAAIQAVQGQRQKKQDELRQRQMAAAQGQVAYPSQHDKLGEMAGLASGLLGGLGGEKKPDAMGEVDDALDSYDAYKGFGGIR